MKPIGAITILIILISQTQLAFSLDNDNWCENQIDLSNDFAPIKDQKDLPYCYAFSVTSLVENYECRNNPQTPCTSFSTMDAISQYPDAFLTEGSPYSANNFTIGENGGYPYKLLEIVRNNGLCPEHFAPFEVTKNSPSERQGWIQLALMFSSLHNFNKSGRCDSTIIDETVNEIMNIVKHPEKKVQNVMTALYEPNSREFLKSLFVSNECVNSRVKVEFNAESLSVDINLVERDRRELIINNISQTLKSNTPLLMQIDCEGANICKDGAGFCGDGGAHALVVKGMRKNSLTGKCELLLHNSWGKSWQEENNGGYVDADLIINNTRKMIWLK